MDPRLQAGVELMIEKTAAEQAGIGVLSNVLRKKASAAGLVKQAEQDQGVEQEHRATNTTPSSSKGTKMEDKNKDYGKGADYKLDDDPSKGEQAREHGDPQISTAGKNITTETGGGMQDLSLPKTASSNARVLTTMLRSF